MTSAVCDSGPLTHLWQIEMWPSFGTFAELHLARQVVKEIEEHVPLGDLQQLSGCAVSHHPVAQQAVDLFVLRTKLGGQLELADLATMVLAEEIKPDFVLTDDLTLRRAVESEMHVAMGSVGILPGSCWISDFRLQRKRGRMRRTVGDAIQNPKSKIVNRMGGEIESGTPGVLYVRTTSYFGQSRKSSLIPLRSALFRNLSAIWYREAHSTKSIASPIWPAWNLA